VPVSVATGKPVTLTRASDCGSPDTCFRMGGALDVVGAVLTTVTAQPGFQLRCAMLSRYSRATA